MLYISIRLDLVEEKDQHYFPVEQHKPNSGNGNDHDSWRRNRLAPKVNDYEWEDINKIIERDKLEPHSETF